MGDDRQDVGRWGRCRKMGDDVGRCWKMWKMLEDAGRREGISSVLPGVFRSSHGGSGN